MGGSEKTAFLGDVSPQDAYEVLSQSPSSLLVDVRTQAELVFVGAPNLDAIGKTVRHVEWRTFPDGRENPGFLSELAALVAETDCDSLLFLCRSGGRSLLAAKAAEGLSTPKALKLLNVAEGFEGDLDAEGRRGSLSGWKVRGLPWRQS